MERELLTLNVWDQFNAKEAEWAATALAKQLPKSWNFEKVQCHEMADQKRQVAFFRWKHARFALIPGGKATLGLDVEHPFLPTAEQKAAWRRYSEYGFPSLKRYLRDTCTRRRDRLIQPFLIDAVAVTSEEIISHEELTAHVTGEGFQLPSSDEWEYACSGGTRHFFRWGDECPDDIGPRDTRTRWRLHRQPNAFGLAMPYDPYAMEAVAEAELLRGGDGGCSYCGGYGNPAVWLPLASSAYFSLRDGPGFEDCEPVYRRLYPLTALLE